MGAIITKSLAQFKERHQIINFIKSKIKWSEIEVWLDIESVSSPSFYQTLSQTIFFRYYTVNISPKKHPSQKILKYLKVLPCEYLDIYVFESMVFQISYTAQTIPVFASLANIDFPHLKTIRITFVLIDSFQFFSLINAPCLQSIGITSTAVYQIKSLIKFQKISKLKQFTLNVDILFTHELIHLSRINFSPQTDLYTLFGLGNIQSNFYTYEHLMDVGIFHKIQTFGMKEQIKKVIEAYFTLKHTGVKESIPTQLDLNIKTIPSFLYRPMKMHFFNDKILFDQVYQERMNIY